MGTSKRTNHNRRWHGRKAAFTLIEITVSVAIISFAFVGVMGLVPLGMNTFRQAMDASVGAQIAQRVINDALQTDFETLVGNSSAAFVQPNRYFDDQGTELTTSEGAIYWLNTRITPITPIPSSDGASSNINLATVTIQVARNPAGTPPSTDAATKLWKSDSQCPSVTYSAMVARNQ